MLNIEKLVNVPRDIGKVTNEPTGFPNKDDSVVSFNDGIRTITIQPTSTQFIYYILGTKYLKTSAQTLVIPDTEGIHFIYFDGATLTSTTTFSHDIFTIFAYVASIYWNATENEAIYLGEERHGITMDGDTHNHFHETFGTRFDEGLALGNIISDDTGNNNSHAQLSVDDGDIHDEDNFLSITDGNPQELSTIAEIPVFYKNGASSDWKKDTATTFPVKNFVGGSGLLAYNQFTGGAWQQTELTNGKFVLAHIFATNDINNPIITIQGEGTYNSIISARTGANIELNDLVTAGLPFEEFVPIATVIYQTSTSYSNTPKARIRTTDLGNDYIDWRFADLSPASPPTDHGNLSGLADDDHLQYILVAGTRAFTGNQSFGDFNITNVGDISLDSISSDEGTSIIVTLGTDAGDDLIVGNNNALVVEGDTDRVGIGTSTPGARLEVTDVFRVLGETTPTFPTTGIGFEIAFDSNGKIGSSGGGNGVAVFQSFSRDSFNYRDLWFRGQDIGFDAAASLALFIDSGGTVAIGGGIKSPLAQLHIDQSSTTAAIPTLYLDQADISEEMIEFNTTIGTGNAIEAIAAKSLTTTHFIKVTLPGALTRYIPCGTIA